MLDTDFSVDYTCCRYYYLLFNLNYTYTIITERDHKVSYLYTCICVVWNHHRLVAPYIKIRNYWCLNFEGVNTYTYMCVALNLILQKLETLFYCLPVITVPYSTYSTDDAAAGISSHKNYNRNIELLQVKMDKQNWIRTK